MIAEFRLINFKCFADQKVELGNLTLLAGANGSGKSSIIQALLLLRQANHVGELKKKRIIRFNGPLVKLGTAQDVAFFERSDEFLAYRITNEQGTIEFNARFLGLRKQDEKDTLVAEKKDFFLDPKCSLFDERFCYLNAERLGPRLWYPIRRSNVDSTTVGVQGEYAIDQLDIENDKPLINPALAFPDRERQESINLGYNTREWMRQIFPNIDWSAPERISKADLVSIAYGTEDSSGRFRPLNTGFGISYSLPIIVAGMLSLPGTMMIVENPEAHLHPAAQSYMGQFLSHVASTGTQVLIETHSDHILNGIRLAVKQQRLTPDRISILFLRHPKNGLSPTIDKLDITSTGRIPAWPAGFFDQSQKDLIGLL